MKGHNSDHKINLKVACSCGSSENMSTTLDFRWWDLHVAQGLHVYQRGVFFSLDPSLYCPCNNGSTVQVPSYVGNDYYCESGNSLPGTSCITNMLEFPEDPLWDGQQCGGVEGPCCTHPNMPWFIKTLNETTTENIELRACGTNPFCIGSGAALFLIEIYIR